MTQAVDAETISAPVLLGVHHLKFPVSDLQRSLEFYERALGAQRQPHFDHIDLGGRLFAYIVAVPGLDTPLELRLAPNTSRLISGFDPVTLAVQTMADVERWAAHLDSAGIQHSGVLRGMIGWLLVFKDPDGLSIRLYTLETHEVDMDNSDIGSPWVQYPAEHAAADSSTLPSHMVNSATPPTAPANAVEA